jgi:hypothetical protein
MYVIPVGSKNYEDFDVNLSLYVDFHGYQYSPWNTILFLL